MQIIRRWLNLSIQAGLLVTLFAIISLAAPVAGANTLPTLHIDAAAQTPLERGIALGRSSQQQFPDITHHYDAYLSSVLAPQRFAHIQQHLLPTLLQQLDTEYQQELEGVISAWGLHRNNQLGDGQLSRDEYLILNLLPDIGFMPDGVGFGVFQFTSINNTPIIGRNLEMPSTPALRALQAITIYQYHDRQVVQIGFAGLLTLFTGFNDRGLFLAHFNAEPGLTHQKATAFTPMRGSRAFELRHTLQHATSVKQAVQQLATHKHNFSYSIFIADREQASVLEYPAGQTGLKRSWHSQLKPSRQWPAKQQIAVVDCLVLAQTPDTCRDVKDSIRWQRLRELALFNANAPANVTDISAIMFDTANDLYEIFSPKTLQSLVYQPGSNTLWLYTAPAEGDHPANPTHQPYTHLFAPELKPTPGFSDVMIMLTIIISLLLIFVIWVSRKTPRA